MRGSLCAGKPRNTGKEHYRNMKTQQTLLEKIPLQFAPSPCFESLCTPHPVDSAEGNTKESSISHVKHTVAVLFPLVFLDKCTARCFASKPQTEHFTGHEYVLTFWPFKMIFWQQPVLHKVSSSHTVWMRRLFLFRGQILTRDCSRWGEHWTAGGND